MGLLPYNAHWQGTLCDELPHNFDIGVFKTVEQNATIKPIHNQSTNRIEGCNVAFDNDDC